MVATNYVQYVAVNQYVCVTDIVSLGLSSRCLVIALLTADRLFGAHADVDGVNLEGRKGQAEQKP